MSLAPSDFGERPHALAERLALIGEGELGALRVHRLGDAPGDGMVVGDPHDEAALARQQRLHGPGHASARFRTIEALVPPKPKPFDRTYPSLAPSTRLRTMGMSAKAGSISSILALAEMKPFCIIRSE